MKKLLFVLSLLCIFTQVTFAQVDERTARKELEKRGLDEDVVKQKMAERGFDMDNIDASNPGELLKAEQALQEVLKEIEDESQDVVEGALEEEIKEVAREGSEEIKESIEDGSTLEEAVTEELIDAQQNSTPDAIVYGQHIFRDKSIKLFRQSKDVKPPETYILGVGDIINVSIWGYSEENATFEINDDGYIKPSRMPRINLKGLSFNKAKKLLKDRFGQHYRFKDNEFEVTLNFARTISVNIVGEVYNYGNFTLPAINNVFNALVAGGGPSDIGSVRNIKLMRAGEYKNIDIYKYLLDPSAGEELYLLENDYIFVPVADRIITISGAIKRPFKYELIESENLLKLIEYAGGLTDNAYKSSVQVRRFENDIEVIKDVNLLELERTNTDFKLLAGDKVSIVSIPNSYKNFVEITGAVNLPGTFAIESGMKISDLINKGILDIKARTDVAYMQRTKADQTIGFFTVNIDEILQNKSSESNLTLEPKDKLVILSKSSFVDKATISVEGAVRNPIDYPFDMDENIKLSDAMLLAGGLRPDATDFAYIFRSDSVVNKQKKYARVNIKNIIENPESNENITLKPFDRIRVFSKLTYTDATYVQVSGAVRNGGQYKYDESLALEDVLTMAGGLKLQASFSRIDIFRVVLDGENETRTTVATIEVDENFKPVNVGEEFQLEPYDQIIVRQKPEFELQRSVSIMGEVKYPGQYALIDKNEKLSSLVKRAGGLASEAFPEGATLYRSKDGVGYVIVKLDEALNSNKSIYNYILKEGDILNIPKSKDLVSISGNTEIRDLYPESIVNKGKLNVAFEKGKNAKHYVDKYAGIGELGTKSKITVEQPNGKVDRTKNYIIFKRYPKVYKGSKIKVGAKKQKKKKERGDNSNKEKTDWGAILASSVTQASAVLTLILLIQRID